ncbi:MAG: undecaprenyldiphospho-muramoylpentapeptide beta-N-acetylglucosaminyltransferase [Lachnospiraceae bacterium]|nr:undecaprenyldiphospho-muramoylpentapeptide beta-N-acetylglucosaminyltransferase [Lachnospiraceae bacterium]
MKKIVLTGGGTAGHVTPNIALIPSLKESGYDISYIGSYAGIEKQLIEDINIPYYGIATGKLRRYFDLKNFSDIFHVIKGYKEAKKILKDIRPDVVFSKGGFVAVPVVRAAAKLNIPCVIHESDMTPGLANKLCIPVAKKICCNFPETMEHMPSNRAVLTGSPIRQELHTGDRQKGLNFTGLSGDKPILMVIGGSQGAQSVNEMVRESLPKLLSTFDVVHLCGKDKVDNMMLNVEGYKQYEYIKDELKDIFAMADMIISRAGANAINEILELKKPNVLIPLSVGSRGDQVLNAESFKASGFSEVIKEEALDPSMLIETVMSVYNDRERYIANMNKRMEIDPIAKITELIKETTGE